MRNKLIEIYNNSVIIKILVFSIINLILIPVAIFLFIIRIFFNIKLVRISDTRIGHLAANTEVFLRRLKLGIIKNKGVRYYGIASTQPCNKQLLKMFKRQMRIIQIPKVIYENIIFKVFSSNKSILSCLGIYIELPLDSNEYYEFNNARPNLKFTKLEEEKGKKLLKKLNIHPWFICFHARDSLYLEKERSRADLYKFRNCDIKNYLKASKYITSKGGFAIRMGAIVEKKLLNLKNPKIIDYATNYRTDFGDIYLSAKCKFFLGCTAGLFVVAQIFNIPIAHTNLIPMEYPPFREVDLFIPKKLWSIREKRFLKFREMVGHRPEEYGVLEEQFQSAGIISIENTREEILDLAKEMNERLDGTWKSTEEDEELQRKFKSLFNKDSHCYGYPARIGTKFLIKNIELLD